MESSSSSKICGEECQGSSESGWTMYIGSSIDDGGGYYGVDGGGGGGGRKTAVAAVDDDDVETDDSMASDASSGPNQQPTYGGEIEEVNGRYNISSKKYKKAMHKKKGVCEEEEMKDDGKEEIMGNDNKGVVGSCNSGWFWGRRK